MIINSSDQLNLRGLVMIAVYATRWFFV